MPHRTTQGTIFRCSLLERQRGISYIHAGVCADVRAVDADLLLCMQRALLPLRAAIVGNRVDRYSARDVPNTIFACAAIQDAT